MDILEWTILNYFDISLILLIPMTCLFTYINNCSNGRYGVGIVLLTSVACSLFWVITTPYIAYIFIVDTFKR